MNDAVISRIADAIAFAEGYPVPGSRPRRNNNPGDLERDLTGKGIGRDVWARNVAAHLGVTVTTRLDRLS